MTAQTVREHRVLVVARDRYLGITLVDDLDSNGFTVSGPMPLSESADTAFTLAASGVPVVVVLADHDAAVIADVAGPLGGTPGIELIAVGEFERVEHVVALFDLGVSDVIRVQCAPAEIRARVNRCLARAVAQAVASFEVCGLTVDIGARTVHRGNVQLVLTRTEFDLLVALLRHPDRVISASELLHRVFRYQSGDTHVLTVHIQRLRGKVELDPTNPTLIKSVRGVGYMVSTQGCELTL